MNLSKRSRAHRDEHGAVAVITAVVAVVLLVSAAFAVDIGNTWARRGMLQQQADQAALFAAEYLPAYDHDAQLEVAKAAAYYLTCHPVVGQDEIDPSIPACPAAPDSTDAQFTAYAQRLLADGNVSFPTIEGSTGTYVDVSTPAAQVDFGLGGAAGVSGSVQTRDAIARVGSPGNVAPMAMSLNCLLSAAEKLSTELDDDLASVLPMNYLVGVKLPTGNAAQKAGVPDVTGDLMGCSRMIKSPRWPQKGTGDNLDLNLVEGLDHPLDMHPALEGKTLPSPLTLDGLLGLIGGSSGVTPSGCSNKEPDRMDIGGSHTTPNCVMPIEGANPFKEFTGGILGSTVQFPANSVTGESSYSEVGRLLCTDERPCKRSFTLPGFAGGAALNDDRFEDFILPGKKHLLTADMFFKLDAYVHNGLPVVTPESILSADIYSSARFMWVPVISSPVGSPRAGSWPIVSFRPIFITPEPPTSLADLDAVLEEVDGWVKTLLGVDDSKADHGLLLDGKGELAAVRYVTIEPSAMPAVPDEYGGPISDYVGTGVKVTRLVR